MQLESIAEISSPNDRNIFDALNALPEDLESTYEKILQEILSQKHKANRVLATNIFRLLIYAERPLTLDELVYATAVRVGQRALDQGDLPSSGARGILRACGNFVKRDELSQLVEFIHLSVRDFLLAPNMVFPYSGVHILGTEAEVQMYMTCICLTYLLFDVFKDVSVISSDPKRTRQRISRTIRLLNTHY